MAITFRNYHPEPLFSDDYRKVGNFHKEINRERLMFPGFTWGRWEWMITHSMLDRSSLGKIGIWEDNDRIVGLATYESELGYAYLFYAPGYEFLLREMMEYSRDHLAGKNGVRVIIDNNDHDSRRIAEELGFVATTEQETTAMIDITDKLSYDLPEGFSIVSMADGWDFLQYNEVMWRGFNHPGAPANSEDELRVRKEMLSSPLIIPEIVLAVVAPDGRYVSHCGMWYAPGDKYALVEPVATHPDFRRMGLGRAVVLEDVKRCGQLGAEVALVGSSQQFYYSIGFYPYHTGNFWSSVKL